MGNPSHGRLATERKMQTECWRWKMSQRQKLARRVTTRRTMTQVRPTGFEPVTLGFEVHTTNRKTVYLQTG